MSPPDAPLLAEGKAGDIILRNDEVRPGDRILDDGYELETVLRVDTYEDHLGISVRRSDGRQSCLDRQPDALTAVRREVKSGSEKGVPGRAALSGLAPIAAKMGTSAADLLASLRAEAAAQSSSSEEDGPGEAP